MAGNGRWGEYVDCPMKGCQHTSRRNNMGTHLIGTHKLAREDAWAQARALPLSSRREQEPYRTPAQRAQQAIERERAVKGVTADVAVELPYEVRMDQLVDCPEGCGATTRRKRIYQHLEKVHRIEHRAALRIGRSLPVSASPVSVKSSVSFSHNRRPRPARAGTRNRATVPAVVVGHKGTQGVDFSEIAPSDIAIAVIQSQVNGMIPTLLLPDVVLYVDHTREMIGKLRSST